MSFDINKPWLSLDDWQKEYIQTQGNCVLVCGRQVGKSTAASIKFGSRAAEKPNRKILMIAYTERQAYELFFKTLLFLEQHYPALIKKKKDKPTKHRINLKNGSIIMCYACGQAGEGIRGFTITDLVIDEAAPMAREVFVSVLPMLSVTGGSVDLLSTPRGKQGFFYEATLRDDFKKFYVSAESCPRHNKEFLEQEKKRMSQLEYAQEYLAQFLDDLMRLFSDELIARMCVLKRPNGIDKTSKHYMGVDIARLGGDEEVFSIIKRVRKDYFEQVENIILLGMKTNETEQKFIQLARIYPFENESIGIDAGAGTLGVSVLDHLLDIDETKRKVVALNNRARSLNRDETSKTRILKEDMYNNLVMMGETGMIKLLDDDEIKASLASVQYEYVITPRKDTKLRIFGNYTHCAEAIIRAAQLAHKDKRLNIWVRSKQHGFN